MESLFHAHRVGLVNSIMTNILVLLAGFGTSVVLSSSVGRGQEFIFAFPTNLQQTISPDETATLSLSITSFSSGPTHINVTVVGLGWSREDTLNSQYDSLTVDLPPQAEARRSALQNTTVFVRASQDVTVLALSTKAGSRGGFLVRSTQNLGVDYFVASYTPTEGESSEFTISATQDNTVVQIQLKAPLMFDNMPYSRGALELSLDRLQTAQFQGTLDLTGSRVTSNLPISVVSGSSASSVPAEAGTAGHLVEHLPPVSTWGHVYALAPFIGQPSGYKCKVVASCPTITVVQGFGETVPLFAAGESHVWDASVSSPAFIIADKPILVVQYSKGRRDDVGSNTGIGDPSMTVIPPVDRFAAGGALLSTPTLPLGANQHLSITIRCNETDGLTLNGEPLIPDRKFGYQQTDTCVAQKKLITTTNVIRVQHSSPTVPLAVSVAVYGATQGAYSVAANLGMESPLCSTADMDECCTPVSLSSADDSSSSYHSSISSDYSSVDGVEFMSSVESPVSNTPATHNSDLGGSILLSVVEANETTTESQMISSMNTTATNTTKQQQSTSTPIVATTLPGSITNATTTLGTTYVVVSNATSSDKAPPTTDSPRGMTTTVNASSLPTISESSSAGMTTSTTRQSVKLTTGAPSTRLSTEHADVTGLASTTSETTPTKQPTTTIAPCMTCQRPYRIVLYGGISLAVLFLIIIVICLVKIILKRREAKRKLHERNSRWVAFPVGISAEELTLTRTKIKPV
ncbi:uncharacterized protein PB18E9.04c-like [Asterias rubens]|uniref:uncharacterized protein PB18E9.04c-like n=1 Tax=Asterias rubens TaxID=7604 RepID=UPI0014552C69|nr:uncharacterized protein PB18E9.04c-like [Asterias rubens]